MNKRLLYLLVLLTYPLLGQDLGQIGKAPLVKINGGISANSVYYNGTANREPFTYFLNGNLNFNISGIYNIPLSFSYTNQDFAYSTPFKINRLSIHPSYKWVATHIGDVAMTFSPYTVSGHQFTGFGTDLTPNGPFKISALYGRFLKPTEYNDQIPEAIPAYKRIGYGLKTSYDFNRFNVGLIFFKAKDQASSLDIPIPEDLNIDPKENLVVSLESSVEITKGLSFNLEVAQSAVTENLEDEETNSNANVLGFLIKEKASTDYYTAFNADVTYSYGKGSLGVGYERIDPQYRTFGAYFFNNDLENITVNASQELFNGYVSLAVNAGLQRDDLKNQKESQSNRIVAAINANIKASDRLNIAASYSNFQSYTNIRTAFDVINEVDPLQNLDTLDFKQVSQNASLNLGYILSQSKQKQQNVGLSLTYQTTKDEQGTADETNNQTDFYNAGANYSIAYPERALTISGAINAAYNVIEENDALTYGPTLSINKQFFDKKLRTGVSASYNQSLANGTSQGNVTNFRANAGYVYKEKHNLNLNALALFRNNTSTASANDFTVTLGYSYSFDVKKPDLRFRKRDPNSSNDKKNTKKSKDTLKQIEEKLDKQNYYRFRYRGEIYDNNADAVADQIEAIAQKEYYNKEDAFAKDKLKSLFADLKEKARNDQDFKNLAIDFLDSIYMRKDYIPVYQRRLQSVLISLQKELVNKDQKMKDVYAKTKFELENNPLRTLSESERNAASDEAQFEYMKIYTKYEVEGEKFEAYLFLRIEVDQLLKGNKVVANSDHTKNIKERTQEATFRMYSEKKDLEKINIYLEEQIIIYFDELYRSSDN
ncbi:hypothetical protein D1815_15535 [Aquimarina sp. AD1]|uniref:hypothetical protein n=1 Tax=Aquimarina sp. (strain AD1) TaxID=1714848 RepID=UPI000E4AF719|nr:hypothetical protein [Aquimarina sp. AD1]AXT57088.1 hypothetical protein D1815_15535 [Aquimarina sp. AD1]RKN35065.1 hypothetical protein D7035_03410 [Aquimarina sp. AD1]